MSAEEVQKILIAIEAQKSEIKHLSEKVDDALTGDIKASRLVWGAGEIFVLLLMVIIPALAAFYGTKSQVDSLSKGFEDHVKMSRRLHPEVFGTAK